MREETYICPKAGQPGCPHGATCYHASPHECTWACDMITPECGAEATCVKINEVDEPTPANRHTISLSDADVDLLISGLLGRVTSGMSNGEDHGAVLSELKHMVGITW